MGVSEAFQGILEALQYSSSARTSRTETLKGVSETVQEDSGGSRGISEHISGIH